jgi:hypothetical protein
MHLVQILLPVADNDGARFPGSQFAALRQELTERFGGVTVFSRSPAEGVWQGGQGTHEDDIVIFEVMAEALDDGPGGAGPPRRPRTGVPPGGDRDPRRRRSGSSRPAPWSRVSRR